MPSRIPVRARPPRLAKRLTSSSLRGVPSGFEASETILPRKPTNTLHDLGQFADVPVLASADVHQRAVVASFHEVHAGVGQDGVVVRAVEVGGDCAHVLPAVLAVEVLAQLGERDLGNGIGLVGGFQRAGEQVILTGGLRAVARVDAAQAQEHRPLHLGRVRAVDEVALDLQVLVDKVRAVRVGRLDAAHLGCGEEEAFRPRLGQVGMHRPPVQQVKFLARERKPLPVASRLQPPQQCLAHHAPVAGDEASRVAGEGCRDRAHGA